ncbi:hypothetical protein RZS08_32810, partial [Arthrospira platensis SPKY1]|nr:hypothetical protein [Arthrospira platensis SPKY1]
ASHIRPRSYRGKPQVDAIRGCRKTRGRTSTSSCGETRVRPHAHLPASTQHPAVAALSSSWTILSPAERRP